MILIFRLWIFDFARKLCTKSLDFARILLLCCYLNDFFIAKNILKFQVRLHNLWWFRVLNFAALWRDVSRTIRKILKEWWMNDSSVSFEKCWYWLKCWTWRDDFTYAPILFSNDFFIIDVSNVCNLFRVFFRWVCGFGMIDCCVETRSLISYFHFFQWMCIFRFFNFWMTLEVFLFQMFEIIFEWMSLWIFNIFEVFKEWVFDCFRFLNCSMN